MAKFCGNCGYQSDDTAVVCGNCGTPLEGEAPVEAKASKLDPKVIKLGAIALAAVIVLIVVIVLLAGGGHKGAVKKVFKAFTKDEPSILVDITPEWMADMTDDLKDSYKAEIESAQEYWEDAVGNDYKVSYKITDIDDYDKEKLDDMKDELEDSLKDMEEYLDKKIDVEVDKIKAIREVELDITVKDGSEKIEYDGEIVLIKYGSKWQVVEVDIY